MQSMYLNSQFTTGASNEAIEVRDPATEEVLDSVPRGTAQDASAAVAAARAAFEGWRRTPANERATLLHTAAAKMREHWDEIVRLLTRDPLRAKRFFEEVRAGTVWINDPLTDNYAGPFGGMKMSGGGRELGQEGLDEFRETKHVHWDFAAELKDWWYPYGR